LHLITDYRLTLAGAKNRLKKFNHSTYMSKKPKQGSKGKGYGENSPQPVIITVVVPHPGEWENAEEGWKKQNYNILRVDQGSKEIQKYVIVASQGQEIRFSGQTSTPTSTGFSFGGDSKQQSPNP
jgi:hypothetical protein